jgi:hypothetical protein
MKKVCITHPGSAHRDEFISCCLLLAAGIIHKILRREPTVAELDDPNILVVDVGGQHCPEKGNYDHHQLPRDADPTCSLTLIMPLLGVSLKAARGIWNWFEFSEWLDSKGPYQTATHLGMEPDALLAMVSPIETTILRWFEEHEEVVHGDLCYQLMERIGREKLEYLMLVSERLEFLGSHATFNQNADESFWLDARCVPKDQNPVLGIEMFLQMEQKDCPITVTNDDRGDGFAIFRRNDDHRVDLSKLEGWADIVFAHRGGFIAKTRKDADVAEMISASFV